LLQLPHEDCTVVVLGTSKLDATAAETAMSGVDRRTGEVVVTPLTVADGRVVPFEPAPKAAVEMTAANKADKLRDFIDSSSCDWPRILQGR
jgi:hypothetical protein